MFVSCSPTDARQEKWAVYEQETVKQKQLFETALKFEGHI